MTLFWASWGLDLLVKLLRISEILRIKFLLCSTHGLAGGRRQTSPHFQTNNGTFNVILIKAYFPKFKKMFIGKLK
jgi:hypothetical protein